MSETVERRVSEHYAHGALEQAILEGLARAGRDTSRLTADDLTPVDEFHIGGRAATVEFAEQLGLRRGMRLLDIGSGIGGPARYFAGSLGCHVTGIDLTEEYVRVATALTGRVGLAAQAEFRCASALALPFPLRSFDGAYMLHVGMNIADKATLIAEVKRVLKPGAVFGIYDVMRAGDGAIAYPVPWASQPETSFVDSPATYRRLLGAAGFAVGHERDRRQFGIEFFRKMQQRIAESGPPPLGLHMVMGAEFPVKVGNLVDALERGALAPTEMISRAA